MRADRCDLTPFNTDLIFFDLNSQCSLCGYRYNYSNNDKAIVHVSADIKIIKITTRHAGK